MDKKKLENGITKMLELGKGKRKFTQSVELIINFRGIDFTKAENRLNLDIVLPKGKGGKEPKIGVIAEENTANQAKKDGADLVILPHEILSYTDPKKISKLADNYALLAEPKLMNIIAKNLGQYLGRRGKMPKPLVGPAKIFIEKAKNSIRLVSKGKYLPVTQAFIGTEKMSKEEIFENADAVFESLKTKVPDGNIKSVYLKLTMSPPVKVM